MYEQERETLRFFCRLAYDRCLVSAADGNFSLRLPDGNILITPSNRNKGLLQAGDMIVLDREGVLLSGSGKASSESRMHSYIYASRPDVNAIFHSHPTHATVFACIGREIPDNYYVGVPLMLGQVPLARFAPPGTAGLVDAIRGLTTDADCILLQNHGALAYGIDMESAFNRLETLESVCKMVLWAEQAGKPIPIPAEAVEEMKKKLRAKRGK